MRNNFLKQSNSRQQSLFFGSNFSELEWFWNGICMTYLYLISTHFLTFQDMSCHTRYPKRYFHNKNLIFKWLIGDYGISELINFSVIWCKKIHRFRSHFLSKFVGIFSNPKLYLMQIYLIWTAWKVIPFYHFR